MARPSKLNEAQWAEIERKHLIEGIPIRTIAKEYNLDPSTLRRRFNPHYARAKPNAERAAIVKPDLKQIAAEKVASDAEARRVMDKIATLPYPQQAVVSELAQTLTNISKHLGKAAEYGAATAHRLSAIANAQIEKVDDAEPMKSHVELANAAALTRMANASAEIGIGLLRANKEAIDALNKPQSANVPAGLGHFYGED